MCGRYSLGVEADELALAFELPIERVRVEHRPRFNVAPGQEAPVLAADSDGRRIGSLRWGLVPHWAEDPRIGNRLINARSETVHSRPAFRGAFRRRRCVVPADGFYEWAPSQRGEHRRPYWFHPEGRGVLAMAGLWESWRGGGDPLHTFTILTRPANDVVRRVHGRMPLLLDDAALALWLDPGADPSDLQAVLSHPPRCGLVSRAVSRFVNSPANEGPDCVVAADP